MHYNDLAGQQECLPCFLAVVDYGFARPQQCKVTFFIFGGSVGLLIFLCGCCFWMKVGHPCCCCCFKRKKYKIPTPTQRSNSKLSSPVDWEIGRMRIDTKKRDKSKSQVSVEVPRQQIPIKIDDYEDPVQWHDINPMHKEAA